MIRSEKAIWGGYSLVDAELRGMERLLEMGEWSHFINLSGQDFPLQPQKQIMAFLEVNADREFIKVLNQDMDRPDTMHRVSEYVIELDQSIQRTARSRPFLTDATPYIGNQWMIVTRAFCEFVCGDPSVDRYKVFLRKNADRRRGVLPDGEDELRDRKRDYQRRFADDRLDCRW